VLLAAAVVGKTFWREVLRTMQVTAGLDGALSVLEARNLIRREASSQVPGDVEFTFRHILIREVAFGTVPRATRRQWHAAVAEHIEQAVGGSTETLAWILAHHWREAGNATKAIPHLLTAAGLAQRGWAKEAAVDLFTGPVATSAVPSCRGRRARSPSTSAAPRRCCAAVAPRPSPSPR